MFPDSISQLAITILATLAVGGLAWVFIYPYLSGEAAAADAKAAPRRKVEPVPVPAAPPRDGIVTLAVSPWGEVSVDGAPRGVSPPLTQLSLTPGVHTIEIRNGAAAPLVARIEVRAGETLGLQHRF